MKIIIRLILITLTSSYSFTASSQDMTTMMKQQMEASISATCSDRSFLNCTGLSQSKCTSAASKTIASCDHLFPKGNAAMNDDAFDAHGECMERNFPKNAGVSTSKLDDCDRDEASEPPVDMTEGITMMNQMLKQHAESIGTDGVTLPIYKNATVMSHFASGELAEMMGVNPLPALILVSPDSTNKVTNYYRTKLKGFTEHKVDDDTLFMQGGPKNFDYRQDFKTYAVTPHVLIGAIEEGPGVPPGSKSKIEIAYKK